MKARALLLAAPLAAACRASAPQDEPRLPFHVALAPVVVTDDLKWQHAEVAPAPDEMEFRLEFPPEALRELEARLETVLEERSFVRVTALLPLTGATASPPESGAVGAALEQEADLLVRCHLRFHPAVVFELDGTFALNIPTWLFLGPLSWLVDDCNYVASAQLTAEFFDLGEAAPRAGDAPGAPIRLLTVTPSFEQTDLDLVDRNGGAVLRYVPSIVIPPGLLSRGSERARAEVRAQILEVLVAGLADAIRQRSEDLVQERQRPRGAFYLDPRTLALHWTERGSCRLHCELVLRPSASVEELHGLAVEEAGGALLREVPLFEHQPRAETDGLRYVLDLDLEPRNDSDTIVLVVRDQSRRRRSFTLALPERPPGTARASAARDGSRIGRETTSTSTSSSTTTNSNGGT